MTDKTGAASYLGAGIAAAVGTVTVEFWAAAAATVLGLATFGVNVYFKHQERQDRLRDSKIRRAADNAKRDYYSGGGDD